jgi:hypothetical protein
MEGRAMNTKPCLAVALLIATIGSASGGEPDVHFELQAWKQPPTFFAIPFVFEDSNLDCPEGRWTITISDGVLRTHYLSLPPIEQASVGMKTDPSDDFTYRLQYIRPNCRVDIDIREQVRSDGEWKSLAVTEERRPSIPKEMRQEAERRRLSSLPLPKDEKPMTQSDLDKLSSMLRPKGGPRWAASTFAMGFPFDEAPPFCMELIGEYRMTKNSFGLALFVPLPGELNKVVMDGVDLDQSHGRIYLTKNDCRFEFTIGQFAVRDRQSIPIPLRPVPSGSQAPVGFELRN